MAFIFDNGDVTARYLSCLIGIGGVPMVIKFYSEDNWATVVRGQLLVVTHAICCLHYAKELIARRSIAHETEMTDLLRRN